MSEQYNLMKYEDIVFALLQEYFQKKRCFNLEKLIPYLIDKLGKKSININKTGIKKILISLLKQNLIVEGISLTKDDILRNENRLKLYEFIKSNPGTYFRRIVAELRMPHHVIIWHLNILFEFRFIIKEKIENRVIYFIPILDFESVKQTYIASKK